MQTQTINTELCRWLDGKCQRIEEATGAKRYHTFISAIYTLNAGQGGAPLSPALDDRGEWHGGSDKAETIMVLETLCWCALSAGVKTETVKRVYEREMSCICPL
jgi:hypothetical protein